MMMPQLMAQQVFDAVPVFSIRQAAMSAGAWTQYSAAGLEMLRFHDGSALVFLSPDVVVVAKVGA